MAMGHACMVMVSSVQAGAGAQVQCQPNRRHHRCRHRRGAVVVMTILIRTPSNDDLFAQHAVPRNTNPLPQDPTAAQ
jgi:hypothetical protein